MHNILIAAKRRINSKLGNSEAGFTLIEMMVVLAIIGILAALIVPRIMGRPDEARITAAKQDIELQLLNRISAPSTKPSSSIA